LGVCEALALSRRADDRPPRPSLARDASTSKRRIITALSVVGLTPTRLVPNRDGAVASVRSRPRGSRRVQELMGGRRRDESSPVRASPTAWPARRQSAGKMNSQSSYCLRGPGMFHATRSSSPVPAGSPEVFCWRRSRGASRTLLRERVAAWAATFWNTVHSRAVTFSFTGAIGGPA
jgi:hypothetical protein